MPARAAVTRTSETSTRLCTLLGGVAVAVDEFVEHIFGVFGRLDGGNALVCLDAPGRVGHVALGQEGVGGDVHQAVALVRLGRFAAGGGDGLAQHFDIEIIANGLHMAVLAVPQQAARAADLQIAHRNAEAGTERRELPDGRQALSGDFGQHAVAAEGEVGVRLAGRTPDAAADLVQLGKAHAVGIFR